MCTETISMRKEFATDLLKKMIENQGRDIDRNKTFRMIEDMLWHAENEEDKKFKTNQALIGIQHLFQECAIKV